MTTIDYYFSVQSPFTYLAGDRLERIAAARGARIDYKPVDTGPVFAASGGVPVAMRPPARLAYRAQDLVRLARAADLPFNLHPAHWPTNAAPASAAVAATQIAGGDAGAVARAVMRAVWAEELDIADPATLSEIVSSTGGDMSALDHPAGAAAYAANSEQAIARGVFGVPFYIVGEALFWGQDRLDALDRHLGEIA